MKIGEEMRNKKIFGIIVILLIASLLIGCTKQGVSFNKQDIVSLHFRLSYPNAITKEANDIVDTQIIDAIYQELKIIKFDKKLPKRDFWSNKENKYTEPAYYHTLGVKLANDKGYYLLYIAMDGKCYRPGEYRIYSEAGGPLHIIMSKYLNNQQES